MDKITVDGVEYDIAAIQNMRDSEKNFQTDYTKKTQVLAEERKDLQEMADFASYLEANPAVAEKVKELFDIQKAGGNITDIDLSGKPKEPAPAPKGKDADPAVAELNAKFDKLQSDLTAKNNLDSHEAKVQEDLKFLDSELTRLKKAFPNMRDKEVLAMVSVDPGIDIEEAAKFSHDEETKSRDKLVQDYLKKKDESNVTILGKGPSATLKIPKPPETMAQARQMAQQLIEAANKESG